VHFLLNGLRHIEQSRLCRKGAVAADAVDGPVACGGHEPRARVGRRSFARPALGGNREGVLGGFLGEVEVAEEADQTGEDAAPLVPEDLLEDS
jgi:hypothetical protein